MSRRSKSAERQVAIIDATLKLLRDTPLARLTTRQIARELGISQPALFRHFHSREQLLLAVMEKVRDDLGAIVDVVLAEVQQPIARLHLLATRLLEHVEAHLGLARLLFSPPEKGLLRDSLRQLVAMQRSLVSQLINDGQQAGVLRADLNPNEAATFYVGMIQGIVLRGQLQDSDRRLSDEAKPMLSLWLNGARASSNQEVAELPPAQTVSPNVTLMTLDVRPILAGGADPLEHILAALATVRATGALTVTAPFRPVPLLRLLGERGHLTVARRIDENVWSIDIVVGGSPSIDDLLDLEPPEPMERVLEATASMASGQSYIARLPRFPRLLVPHLSERPVEFEFCEAIDGTGLLHIEARS